MHFFLTLYFFVGPVLAIVLAAMFLRSFLRDDSGI